MARTEKKHQSMLSGEIFALPILKTANHTETQSTSVLSLIARESTVVSKPGVSDGSFVLEYLMDSIQSIHEHEVTSIMKMGSVDQFFVV